MLTLTFLGVGSAYAKRNYQSNALLEAWARSPNEQNEPDETLLVDFGTTGPIALYELHTRSGFEYLGDGARINYPAIRRIFITHCHSDHVGGLEELAGMMTHCFGNDGPGGAQKPQLIGTSELLDRLWRHSLSGGLGVVSGRSTTLTDYFDLVVIEPSGRSGAAAFSLLDRYDFSAIPTNHIYQHTPYDWPSFGLWIRDRQTGATAVYSGDTRFDSGRMAELMHGASMNFHEVQLVDQADPVHATLAELRGLSASTRKKMWLYHYGDDWDDPRYRFVADEFAGFAEPQKRYTVFE